MIDGFSQPELGTLHMHQKTRDGAEGPPSTIKGGSDQEVLSGGESPGMSPTNPEEISLSLSQQSPEMLSKGH